MAVVYLINLGGSGFLGPDEPRYASIGREMAQSHDVITPRLNGSPWFEKPPLLYWTTAAAKTLRLPDEWAARLPVVLMSLAFLFFFSEILAREFSARIAIAATAILATSAGWIGFSFAAVPDLPMTAALSAAMMITLFDTRREQGYVAGILLGLAILAKGFVPVVLFAPLLLIARRKRLRTLAAAIAVAAPWYLLCYWRNGSIFWQEFFWKHHVQRFLTPLLEHVQPFWYYIPVILAGLFPWTPLAALLFRSKTYDDVRVRSLALWLIYALLFFSVSRNKLPGYVLPLIPPLAIVFAVALEKTGAAQKWLISACAALLTLVPAIALSLPDMLLFGIRHVAISIKPGLPLLGLVPLVWWLAWRDVDRRQQIGLVAVALFLLVGVVYLKGRTLQQLDQRVSVRPFWLAHRAELSNACIGEELRRDWEYGLDYYESRAIPQHL